MIFTNSGKLKRLNLELDELKAILEEITSGNNGRRGLIAEKLDKIKNDFDSLSHTRVNRKDLMDACAKWDVICKRNTGVYHRAKTTFSNGQLLRGVESSALNFGIEDRIADQIVTTTRFIANSEPPKTNKKVVVAGAILTAAVLSLGAFTAKFGADKSKIQKEYDGFRNEMAIAQQEHQSHISSLENERDGYKNERDSWEVKYNRLLEEKEKLEEQLKNTFTQKDKEALEQQIKEKDEEISSLTEALGIKEDAVKEAEQKLEEANATINKYKEDYSTLSVDYKDVLGKWNEALLKIEGLESDLQTYITENNSLKLQIKELEDAISSGVIDDDTLAGYLQRINSLEEQVEGLNSLIEEKTKALDEANKQIEDLGKELETVKAEKANLKTQIEGLNKQVAEKQSEIDKLTAQLENSISKEDYEKVIAQIEELKKQIAEKQSEIDKLTAQLENSISKDEYENIKSQIEGLNKQIAEKQSEIDKLTAQLGNSVSKEEYEKLQSQLADAIAEKDELNKKYGQLIDENGALNDKIAGFEDQLKELQDIINTSSDYKNIIVEFLSDKYGVMKGVVETWSTEQLSRALYNLVGGEPDSGSYAPGNNENENGYETNLDGNVPDDGSFSPDGDGNEEGYEDDKNNTTDNDHNGYYDHGNEGEGGYDAEDDKTNTGKEDEYEGGFNGFWG